MIFYRYEIVDYLPEVKVGLVLFELIRETPQGYWIAPQWASSYRDSHRWIPKVSKKRYAYPTKKEAMNSYIIRTKKRLKYLEGDLVTCKYALRQAKIIQESL